MNDVNQKLSTLVAAADTLLAQYARLCRQKEELGYQVEGLTQENNVMREKIAEARQTVTAVADALSAYIQAQQADMPVSSDDD